MKTKTCLPIIASTEILLPLLLATLAHAQFPAPDDFNPGANSSVYALALQSDRKILLGGSFTELAGQPRCGLARVHANGDLDTSFDCQAGGEAHPAVYSLIVQPDQKIIVAGFFTKLGGEPRHYIARLHANGALDHGFNPAASDGVSAMCLQPDGKILVANFAALGGVPSTYLARLHPDGTLDTGFNPAPNNAVATVTVQPDGKILVGGGFTMIAGQPRNYFARLNADGSLDDDFDPGPNSAVYAILVQPDENIVIGGYFRSIGEEERLRIARLKPDGALDAGFNPGAGATVVTLALQADGRILIGGEFITLGGQSRLRVARLNADGSVDTTLDPQVSGSVQSLALQSDGKILVGGAFSSLGGQSRKFIARLNNTESATESLDFDGSTITWLRGGTNPEIGHRAIRYSADGVTWTDLGGGAPVPGGWQVTGLSLPPGGTIWAQGYVTGGYRNGSVGRLKGSMVRRLLVARPASRTSLAPPLPSLWSPSVLKRSVTNGARMGAISPMAGRFPVP